jgi:hypothetical protein
MVSLSRDDEEAGLGYALLRLSEAAGDQPIGGATLERTASLRRWIELQRSPAGTEPGDGLIIVHYPRGRPLEMSISTNAVRGSSPDRTRLFYEIEIEAGSSGAPCFAVGLELVAMHLGRAGLGAPSPNTSVGTPIDALRKKLESNGYKQALYY